MTEEGTRSRILGALLWSMFAAAALVLVLFTFVAAYGDGHRNRYATTSMAGAEVPSRPELVSPLCPALPPSGGPEPTAELASARVDRWAAERQLTAASAWMDVPAAGTLRGPADACVLVAVVGSPRLRSTPQAPCADIRVLASCTEPIVNGPLPVRARMFSMPTVTAHDVGASGIPPLVYYAHAMLEPMLAHTPYRPAGAVADVPIGTTHTRTPAFTGPGCVLWAGMITNTDDVLGLETVIDCGSPPELSTHNGGTTIWLRPYRRAMGPNVERTDHPAPLVRAPLRRAALEAALEDAATGT